MPGFLDKLIRGARMAALVSEPPEHRLQRLSLENRVRATDQQLRNSSAHLELAKQREERFAGESERRQGQQDLETRLRLASSGVQLSPEQRRAHAGGELLAIDLGSGVAAGPDGGTFVEHNGEQFFIPGRQAQADVALNQGLDARQAELDLERTIPITGERAQSLGVPEGTKVSPTQLDDLMRAQAQLQPREASIDKVTTTDKKTGQSYRVYIQDGKELYRVPLGQTATPGGQSRELSPSEQRAREKDKQQQQISETASQILFENGNDVERAIQDLERRARFDESGFTKKNLTKIRKELRALRDTSSSSASDQSLQEIFGDSLPPEVLGDQLQRGPAPSPQPIGTAGGSPAALEYLKSIGGR